MDGTDLRWFVERLRLIAPEPRLPSGERRRLFLEPRCHGTWLPQDVPDDLLEEAWDLARMGPTSANGSPLRLVLLRSAAEKARLLPTLDQANREKSRLAPVVAILAYDTAFWRHLHRLHPHVDAAAWFRDDPELARETAFRNGTLQAAYFMLRDPRPGCGHRRRLRLRRGRGPGQVLSRHHAGGQLRLQYRLW